MLAAGVDIGGTTCSVCVGTVTQDSVEIISKCAPRKTHDYTPGEMLDALVQDLLVCQKKLTGEQKIQGIGISCGGPLNSRTGTILSPPNLLGWDAVEITRHLKEETGLDAALCNDANACALAEWRFGAGKGSSNLIFLTFGTGLGAGLILNDRLYSGTSDMAGEVGHIRLADFGPVGYGKMGSFEGFCSGGGIAQFAKAVLLERIQAGEKPNFCPSLSDIPSVTAKTIGLAAKQGDKIAQDILKQVGIQLGKGLSILIDVLNPEKIVIGSIFARCYEEIWPSAKTVIENETLAASRTVCRVVPAKLSESVGDIAALTVAWYNQECKATI